MTDLPRMLHLTLRTGGSVVISISHIVAIIPEKKGCTILTTPGVVYAVLESEATIDGKWT